MYVKIHEDKRNGRCVIAICDENIIGKKINEGKLKLELTERFYKGEKKTKEEVKSIMEKADNLNLAGKEAVGLAIKLGIVNEESTIKIKGVPHAQIYSF